MEFAKGMYELKGKTIKDMRMGEFSDMAIFATTDNMVMIVKFGVRNDDDSYEEIGCKMYNRFMCQRYLTDNRGTREWLYNIGVMSKEELENYDVLLKEKAAKALEERKLKDIENDKIRLKQLMEKYPEIVKETLDTDTK